MAAVRSWRASKPILSLAFDTSRYRTGWLSGREASQTVSSPAPTSVAGLVAR